VEQSPLLKKVLQLSAEPNPVLVENAEQRAQSIQNRIADRITAFAGSMWFVYIHIAWFSCWIGFGVEKYPYGLLTTIVSLEAIFLSTFVMSPCRAAGEFSRLAGSAGSLSSGPQLGRFPCGARQGPSAILRGMSYPACVIQSTSPHDGARDSHGVTS
jgi:hypothetical protein